MKDHKLTLAVSGKLWNRSLVMIDSETKSLWSHLLGECMDGELKGAELEGIPSDMVTWKAWRDRYPETTVLDMTRTSQNYSKEFYSKPDQFVVGLMSDGRPRHSSFATLKTSPILNVKDETEPLVLTFDPESTSARVFSRKVDDRILTFRAADAGHMKDQETGSTWNRATGTALDGTLQGRQLEAHVGIVSFRRAWQLFHPTSIELTP